MKQQPDYRPLGCSECTSGTALGFNFTMAFQPIIDCTNNQIYAYEALVRGCNGEPAGEIFKFVNETNRYRFDQTCRVKAIQLAASLGMQSKLSINFMPNAVYKPELCIRTTLNAAKQYGFPTEQIIFEFTEDERVTDTHHLKDIINYYNFCGFSTAIDDFGAGYSGLNLLAEMHTDLIKLDIQLIHDIHLSERRQAIIEGIIRITEKLGIRLLAEGVEQEAEFRLLQSMGIELFLGYFFARPGFETLPTVRSTPLLQLM